MIFIKYAWIQFIIEFLIGFLIFSALMPPINRHLKLILQLSLLPILSSQLMHANTGLQLYINETGFFSLIMQMMSS